MIFIFTMLLYCWTISSSSSLLSLLLLWLQEVQAKHYLSKKQKNKNKCHHGNNLRKQQHNKQTRKTVQRMQYHSILLVIVGWLLSLSYSSILCIDAFQNILIQSRLSSSSSTSSKVIMIERHHRRIVPLFLFNKRFRLFKSLRKYEWQQQQQLSSRTTNHHKRMIPFHILSTNSYKRIVSSSSATTSETSMDSEDNNNNNINNPKTTIQNQSNDHHLIIPNGITLKIAVDENGAFAEDIMTTTTIEQTQKEPIQSVRFTCSESLDMVHRLRCVSDVVLIGKNTVIIDNPSLTIRRNVQCNRCSNDTTITTTTMKNNQSFQSVPSSSSSSSSSFQPLRVILDPQLSLLLRNNIQQVSDYHDDSDNETKFHNFVLSNNYTLFQDGLPTIIYHTIPIGRPNMNHSNDQSNLPNRLHMNQDYNFTSYQINDFVTLVCIRSNTATCNNTLLKQDSSLLSSSYNLSNSSTTIMSLSSSMNVEYVVHHLYHYYNVKHIMVEGGPTTAKYFLEKQLVDRCIIVKAPIRFINPYYGPKVLSITTNNNNNRDDDNVTIHNNNTNNSVTSALPSSSSIISHQYLSNVAGLEFLGKTLCGNIDTIEYWSKPSIGWPSSLLSTSASNSTKNILNHNYNSSNISDVLFQWP